MVSEEKKAFFVHPKFKSRQTRRREFFCKIGNGSLAAATGLFAARVPGKH